MIKLVVTDVDGTIVGKDEVLKEEMVACVKELQQRGIHYTIATGRVDGLVRHYIEKMGIEIPYIACNGSTIIQKDKVLVRKTIPLKDIRQIIERADEMNMSVMYSIEGIEYAYRQTDYVSEQQEKYNRYHNPKGFTNEEWLSLQVDKVIIMAAVRDGSIGEIEELCKGLPEIVGYKRYANKAIDILHGEANKEHGVRELADMMGVTLNEVLFAGDDLNDIEILRAAGIGIAVANAQPPAKEAADYIAERECYEGVIEAIKKFV